MHHYIRSAALLTLASTSFAQQELYIHGSDGVIYRIDNYATQPTPVLVGAPSFLTNDVPTDIAVDPISGDFFMTVFPNGNVGVSFTYRVDRTTFAATRIGPFANSALNTLEFTSDGRLFGNTAIVHGLVHIDVATGEHQPVATTFSNLPAGDVATSVEGQFLFTTQAGEIEAYDPISGFTSSLGVHGLPINNAYGFEIDTDGVAYIISSSGNIHSYDLATMTPTLIGNTGLEVYGAAFKLPAGPPVGDVLAFCQSTQPNSTGTTGRMETSGSTVAADNDLTLVAADLPPNSFGLFLGARTPNLFGGPTSLGATDGSLCLGDPPGIFRGPGQIQSAGSSGQFSLLVDLTSLPPNAGATSVMAGDSIAFQTWFRDSGPRANNFTNSVIVFFR